MLIKTRVVSAPGHLCSDLRRSTLSPLRLTVPGLCLRKAVGVWWVAPPPHHQDSVLLLPAAAAAKSLQSCPTPRPHRQQPTRIPHPWDSPGKNAGVGCHFLLYCMKVKSLSCVRFLATPWTAAHQAPPSTRFSRQEYWSGVP